MSKMVHAAEQVNQNKWESSEKVTERVLTVHTTNSDLEGAVADVVNFAGDFRIPNHCITKIHVRTVIEAEYKRKPTDE